MSKRETSLKRLHEKALQSFDLAYEAGEDERRQAMEDRRFYTVSGAMWEDQFGDQFANRPKLEINKIHAAIIKLITEYRNNPVSVSFLPIDNGINDSMADVCNDVYRASESNSVAVEAYDNAFEEAVGGGFGAYRLRAVYEDEYDMYNDRQKIVIEPIYDADSTVFFDLDAKRQDKSDATECWVLTPMTPDRYRDTYDDDPNSWPSDLQQWAFDWFTPDLIYVAEYYRVELQDTEVRVFSTLTGDTVRHSQEDFEQDTALESRLSGSGAVEIARRTVKRRRVHKYILSGNSIIEDCGYIAGVHIPIVPQYGKRWVLQGVERFMGHVRLAKDPSRLKNMQVSRLAEMSVSSSDEKPIVTPEQVAGHETMWANDNIENYPYLLLNPVTDATGSEQPIGPVGYSKPSNVPPTLAALHQVCETDIQDILGNLQPGEQIQPRISGKAVELIHNRLDMQAYIYMSNTANARRRGGEIWLSMAAEIFTEKGRVLKTQRVDGADDTIELLRPVQDENSGETIIENDFSNARMEVSVDVGPSFSSRRAATVTALTNMMAVVNDPETTQVLGGVAIMNMEGEGLSDVRRYYREQLIRRGVLKPTEKEAEQLMKEMQNAPPDPNAEYLKAAAIAEQARGDKAQAETVKVLADAEKIAAETDRIGADTLSTLNELSEQELNRALQNEQRLSGNQSATKLTENSTGEKETWPK